MRKRSTEMAHGSMTQRDSACMNCEEAAAFADCDWKTIKKACYLRSYAAGYDFYEFCVQHTKADHPSEA